MPESMFGRPSQHLLPSHPPTIDSASPVLSDPLSFKDFHFNSIGKQPELLSRISLSQPEHTDYHSPTPSPISPPLPTNTAFISQSSSRPTLFQQLAGSNSGAMDGGSRAHVSTSQSNGSLASRIQMNVSSSNDLFNTAHAKTTSTVSPPLRINTSNRATEGASLIPPVEVLPQPSDSSSPSPASLAPTLEPLDVHSPTSSTLLENTGTTRTSQIPTPITTANVVSKQQTEPSSSFAGVDPTMQDLEPSSSAAPTINSLVAQQERLQAISASLANLASLPPSSSHSSTPDLSSVARASANITPHQSNQLQHSAIPLVLRHPYSANQSSSRIGLNIGEMPMDTNDSSLSLVPSPTTLTQEHQAQRRGFLEAVQNLNFALHSLHRVQVDSEHAFTHQLRVFEEQRAVFEQTKVAEVARLQQESQELQQKREELNAKEADLALWEKESKAREDARRAMIARRQAQEEERRAAEAKRIQETQGRIAAAMKEVMEAEALTLRTQHQYGQLASETVPDDLPTEPQEDMIEEEIAAIKSRNDILYDVKRFRQLHMEKVQKLDESNRTLRRLQEERKKRQIEEAENRRIVEEERLRAHAEAQRARQVQDEEWRQLEAEEKRQAIEDGRERGRLLVERQLRAHAEAQAHNLGRPKTTSSQTSEHLSYPEEVIGPQQLAIPDVTRIRATHETNPRSPAATNATRVDADERISAFYRTVPSPVVHTSPRASQSTPPQLKQKKDKPVSGGVMLAAPATKARGGRSPPKPLAKPASLSSSTHVTENAVTSPGTLAIGSVSGEGFNRAVDTPTDMRSILDSRPPFPRALKSQTILDAANVGSQELNIGPAPGVSPAQQNVNLRHLKRSRGHVEENDSGDRSVRTINMKCEETSFPSLKKEEDDDHLREPVSASLSTSLLAPLPPRPSVIPPPRPWLTKKRHAVSASQADSTSSCLPKSNEVSSTREAEVTTDEQPRGAQSRVPSSLAMDAPVHLPAPTETTNSLLLRPVHPEIQSTESRINANERSAQDCTQNYDITSSESATATLSHELDGEDPSRNNRRSTEEYRRTRNENSARRLPDHFSPPLAAPRAVSPTQPHRLIDSWRPQNIPNGPRAEPMRATSPPTTGRKRPSEFNDNEPGHRARRHRPGHSSSWIPQDHDRTRVDSYRPQWDRRLDSEHDERRVPYRGPPSPPDRMRPYPSDIPRATYDNRTYVPASEESITLPARREQSYRNDDAYQRYQPPASDYHAMAAQYYADDSRVGQTYEPVTEDRIDTQPDPSLLARISTTQRFPISTNSRGRGKSESSRGRSDSGRGYGRGSPTRGGPPLIQRLRNGPSSSLGDRSLGDRLT